MSFARETAGAEFHNYTFLCEIYTRVHLYTLTFMLLCHWRKKMRVESKDAQRTLMKGADEGKVIYVFGELRQKKPAAILFFLLFPLGRPIREEKRQSPLILGLCFASAQINQPILLSFLHLFTLCSRSPFLLAVFRMSPSSISI